LRQSPFLISGCLPEAQNITGPGRIRTYVGVNQRIYSPPPLTARAPTHYRAFEQANIRTVEKIKMLKCVQLFHCSTIIYNLLFQSSGNQSLIGNI
jgi:hypothetical protein